MITSSIAVLLAAGLLAAKICQQWRRLPYVTAYILAGLLLFPSAALLWFATHENGLSTISGLGYRRQVVGRRTSIG